MTPIAMDDAVAIPIATAMAKQRTEPKTNIMMATELTEEGADEEHAFV
jgi:hypothetical protein